MAFPSLRNGRQYSKRATSALGGSEAAVRQRQRKLREEYNKKYKGAKTVGSKNPTKLSCLLTKATNHPTSSVKQVQRGASIRLSGNLYLLGPDLPAIWPAFQVQLDKSPARCPVGTRAEERKPSKMRHKVATRRSVPTISTWPMLSTVSENFLISISAISLALSISSSLIRFCRRGRQADRYNQCAPWRRGGLGCGLQVPT